jgi:AcrR family transcriptional regulator
MGSAGDVQALVTDPKLVEERRGQIVRAAVKLFSEDGYYTTTIQQIAKQAGISTGLIYQYFRDKDDILFLSLKMVLDTYEHEIPSQTQRDSPIPSKGCASRSGPIATSSTACARPRCWPTARPSRCAPIAAS